MGFIMIGLIENFINNDKNMPLVRLSCFWKNSIDDVAGLFFAGPFRMQTKSWGMPWMLQRFMILFFKQLRERA